MSSFVAGLYGSRVAQPVRRRHQLRWSGMVAAVAAGAGHALRAARRVVMVTPGVAGPLLVSYGAWLAWPPAGFVVAGVFLLLLDRRSP